MFKKKLIILSVVSFIMLISLVMASVDYTRKVNHYNRFFLTEVEPRSNALNALLTSFGYGHAIHNFKNLLIRGKHKNQRDKYLQRMQFNKRQFYFALYNYVALINQNSLANNQLSQHARHLIRAERASLKQIKSVFEKYVAESLKVYHVYEKTESCSAQPCTVATLDAQVVIEDKGAIEGMKMLQVGISQLRTEVLNKSHQLVETLNILIILATLVLAVFICTAIVFAFQLLRPIIQLQKLIATTQSTTRAVNQFHYRHNDEVAQLLEHFQTHPD